MSLDTLISRLSPAWAARRAERRLRARVTEEREQALLALAAHDAAEYSRNTADWNTRLLSSDQAVSAISRRRLRVPATPSGTTGRRCPSWTGTSGISWGSASPLCEREASAHRQVSRRVQQGGGSHLVQWARDKNLCHTERHWNFTGLEALTVREEVTAGITFALFNYTPRADTSASTSRSSSSSSCRLARQKPGHGILDSQRRGDRRFRRARGAVGLHERASARIHPGPHGVHADSVGPRPDDDAPGARPAVPGNGPPVGGSSAAHHNKLYELYMSCAPARSASPA